MKGATEQTFIISLGLQKSTLLMLHYTKPFKLSRQVPSLKIRCVLLYMYILRLQDTLSSTLVGLDASLF